MYNLTDLTKSGLQQPETTAPRVDIAKQVFMALHGFYGNLFVAKFATGELDVNGKDKGVRSALQIWGEKLAAYPPEVAYAAVHECEKKHKQYPPSWPEFKELCDALMPRKTFFELGGKPLVMLTNEVYSEKSRAIRAEQREKLNALKNKIIGKTPIDLLR
jgi:hypothetical protein